MHLLCRILTKKYVSEHVFDSWKDSYRNAISPCLILTNRKDTYKLTKCFLLLAYAVVASLFFQFEMFVCPYWYYKDSTFQC